jgi:hypothetical protein
MWGLAILNCVVMCQGFGFGISSDDSQGRALPIDVWSLAWAIAQHPGIFVVYELFGLVAAPAAIALALALGYFGFDQRAVHGASVWSRIPLWIAVCLAYYATGTALGVFIPRLLGVGIPAW